jgi:hypothetical protein
MGLVAALERASDEVAGDVGDDPGSDPGADFGTEAVEQPATTTITAAARPARPHTPVGTDGV